MTVKKIEKFYSNNSKNKVLLCHLMLILSIILSLPSESVFKKDVFVFSSVAEVYFFVFYPLCIVVIVSWYIYFILYFIYLNFIWKYFILSYSIYFSVLLLKALNFQNFVHFFHFIYFERYIIFCYWCYSNYELEKILYFWVSKRTLLVDSRSIAKINYIKK